MSINPRWFPAEIKQKTPEEQEKYEKTIRSNVTALRRLKEIIQQLKAGEENSRNPVDYDCPSWAYKQADRLGRIKVYNDILILLDFVK